MDVSPSSTAPHLKIWIPVAILCVVVGLYASPCRAGYPSRVDAYVNDFAELLGPAGRHEIREALRSYREQHDVHVVVVTLWSTDDYRTEASTFEQFATGLFNHWGIGDAEADNGIMLLLAHGDRNVRIEVGAGYGSRLDATMQDIVDRSLMPKFRSGSFEAGLVSGTNAILMQLNARDLRGPVESHKPSKTAKQAWLTWVRSLPLWLTSILGGAASLLSFLAVKRYLRLRPRRCPECSGKMVRLDESAEDDYLDAGQQSEEILGSVDYDIWHCSDCDEQTTEFYKNAFKSHEICSECFNRTVSVHRSTEQAATISRHGVDLETSSCFHCDHQSERRITTPRLMDLDSDSGSGGSSGFSPPSGGAGSFFGGGSSSGGGAGGSW